LSSAPWHAHSPFLPIPLFPHKSPFLLFRDSAVSRTFPSFSTPNRTCSTFFPRGDYPVHPTPSGLPLSVNLISLWSRQALPFNRRVGPRPSAPCAERPQSPPPTSASFLPFSYWDSFSPSPPQFEAGLPSCRVDFSTFPLSV